MSIQLKLPLGIVHISDEVISVTAGSAALECYGLVGMSSRKQFSDGISELLGRDNLKRGIEIRREADQLHIDLHIIVSYGTKISEVANNVQRRVKYILHDVLGINVDSVQIIVQGVQVSR